MDMRKVKIIAMSLVSVLIVGITVYARNYQNTMELFNLEGITRIHKRGNEQVKGVAGLTLKIDKGEYILILGPSGAGKTIFLNVLGCIDSLTSSKLIFIQIMER
jgi:predicted ABC-type transport system involved in lysophospholipase L1 biosynthesis ATPase subunit